MRRSSQLRCERVKIFQVNHHHFEDLVERIYKRKYDFVNDTGCRVDCSIDCVVDGRVHPDDYDLLEKFKEEGEHYFIASILLDDMCNKRLIKNGHYYIKRWF